MLAFLSSLSFFGAATNIRFHCHSRFWGKLAESSCGSGSSKQATKAPKKSAKKKAEAAAAEKEDEVSKSDDDDDGDMDEEEMGGVAEFHAQW